MERKEEQQQKKRLVFEIVLLLQKRASASVASAQLLTHCTGFLISNGSWLLIVFVTLLHAINSRRDFASWSGVGRGTPESPN